MPRSTESTASIVPVQDQATPDSQLQVASEGHRKTLLGPSNWTAATWIEQQYQHDRTHLLHAVQFFSTARTVPELTAFLAAIPPESRWIHPLLPFFMSHRNKKAVLFLLLCPKRNQSIEMTPVDKHLFTAHLVRPIGDLITRTTEKPVIYANFCKQCRRDKKDGNCLTITQSEITLFNIATRVELLIAKNVFGITFTHTMAWSKQFAGIGGGLDALLSWDSDHLLGQVLRIHSHPRWFKMPGIGVDIGKICFRASVWELLCPPIALITKQQIDDVVKELMGAYESSPCPAFAPLVYGTAASVTSVASDQQQLLYPTDPTWFASNRLMLASWAMMARMPWAAGLVRDGRLPDYYLTLPRGLATDAVGWVPATQDNLATARDLTSAVLKQACQASPSGASAVSISIDTSTGLPAIAPLWKTDAGDF